MKYIHINMSVRQYSDCLAGFLPAKGSGCGMYFME
jgi:hypothetical protein